MANSNINSTESTGPSGPVDSRPCTKCKINPRRGNSSWCQPCLNSHAAEYRERLRKKVVTEERVCAWENCEEKFTWRSSHPKQVCCCKSHYERYAWRRDNPRKPEENLPEGQKRCIKCSKVRGITDFSPSQWKKKTGQCRDCWRIYEKNWSSRNTEKRSAASRRSRRKRLLVKYGAPSDDFDFLLDQQGGVCKCCGGPKGQKEWHIDHDHNKPEAESYRGLLCHGCNVGLGAFGDDPDRLRAAISYLTA